MTIAATQLVILESDSKGTSAVAVPLRGLLS